MTVPPGRPSVLDASAVLALVQGEAGADSVRAHLDGGVLSTANLAEILAKSVDAGQSAEVVGRLVGELGLRVEPVTQADAVRSAQLHRHERDQRRPRLSLADRLCLALAMREDGIAVTADREWTEVDLPVAIDLIH